MKQPYLSVIIPVRNEAKRMPNTLIDIDKHLSKVPFEYEILIIENGSQDATFEIAKRFAEFIKNIRIIRNSRGGKGLAVQRGMLEAKGKIRLFTDADNSTTIDHFFAMEQYFKEGYDIVIGSRDVEGAKLVPPQPWYKQVLGNIGNLIIQILLLPGIPDTQCGFKAFTERAATEIFPRMTVERWGFDFEVLAIGKLLGFKTKQIPVTWVNDIRSGVSASAYAKTLLEVLKVKWQLMRGVYAKKPADQATEPKKDI